jgi:hypothetical protein
LTDMLEISCECIGHSCLLVMLAMRLDVMILNWLVSSLSQSQKLSGKSLGLVL